MRIVPFAGLYDSFKISVEPFSNSNKIVSALEMSISPTSPANFVTIPELIIVAITPYSLLLTPQLLTTI